MTLTRRLILQKARCHFTRKLQRFVCKRFQILFHSPCGVLFTFPSRYLFTIGHQGVFRLSGWSRQIHTRFHESGITWDTNYKINNFRLQGSHLLCLTFPRHSSSYLFFDLSNYRQIIHFGPTTPIMQRPPTWHMIGFASSAFARHY